MTTALQAFWAAFVGGLAGAAGTDLLRRWRGRRTPAPARPGPVTVGPTGPCRRCGKPDSPVVAIVAWRQGGELNLYACARHRNETVDYAYNQFGDPSC